MEGQGSGVGRVSYGGANPASAAQQQKLEQQLDAFWAKQYADIEKVCNFKNNGLPLARIRKIIKSDGDVKMISAEAPVVFARACEMFILELTLRSWNYAEENKRRTIQKSDIAGAIVRTDVFDFLVDILPREDPSAPVAAVLTDAFPYYCYMSEAHNSPQGPQPGQPSSAPPTPHSNPSSSRN